MASILAARIAGTTQAIIAATINVMATPEKLSRSYGATPKRNVPR